MAKPDFVYHAPTEIAAPKYAAIREACAVAGKGIEDALAFYSNLDRQARLTLINDSTKALAETIAKVSPACADTTTAIRCVRLARMRANESIMTGSALDWRTCLTDARMWACADIALDD